MSYTVAGTEHTAVSTEQQQRLNTEYLHQYLHQTVGSRRIPVEFRLKHNRRLQLLEPQWHLHLDTGPSLPVVAPLGDTLPHTGLEPALSHQHPAVYTDEAVARPLVAAARTVAD